MKQNYFIYMIYGYQKLCMDKTKPGKKMFAKISSLAGEMAKNHKKCTFGLKSYLRVFRPLLGQTISFPGLVNSMSYPSN